MKKSVIAETINETMKKISKRLHDGVLQRPNKLFTFAAFFKKVTMTTAEERYEETWNNYLVLLNKDPNVSLASFTKSKYNTPIFSNQCISQINFVTLHSQ